MGKPFSRTAESYEVDREALGWLGAACRQGFGEGSGAIIGDVTWADFLSVPVPFFGWVQEEAKEKPHVGVPILRLIQISLQFWSRKGKHVVSLPT